MRRSAACSTWHCTAPRPSTSPRPPRRQRAEPVGGEVTEPALVRQTADARTDQGGPTTLPTGVDRSIPVGRMRLRSDTTTLTLPRAPSSLRRVYARLSTLLPEGVLLTPDQLVYLGFIRREHGKMSELAHNEEASQNLRDTYLLTRQMASEEERAATIANVLFPSWEDQTAHLLSLVHRIVSDGWDRTWASDSEGNQLEEWREEAVNFSVLAALLKAWYVLEDVVDFMAYSRAAECVSTEISKQTGSQEVDFYSWQAAPDQTKEDVLRVIENALRKVKAQSTVSALRRAAALRKMEAPPDGS